MNEVEVAKADERDTRFRIDKFVVPGEALDEFVAKMKSLQETLRSLPGCELATVLTQTGGPGRFNVVTLVHWADPASVENAVKVMQAKFSEEGFNPAAFTERLRIEPDLGLYATA